jgi:hypothetical protein
MNFQNFCDYMTSVGITSATHNLTESVWYGQPAYEAQPRQDIVQPDPGTICWYGVEPTFFNWSYMGVIGTCPIGEFPSKKSVLWDMFTSEHKRSLEREKLNDFVFSTFGPTSALMNKATTLGMK